MAEDSEGIQYLLDLFQSVPDGYLVDVGAHDGVAKGSMTRDLIVRGWGGLLVEPLPEAYALLYQAYKDTPSVRTINAACSDVEGHADLFPCLGVSTLESDWAKACSNWWKHVRYGKPIRVQTFRLSTLLKQIDAPTHIHLLQIDTEGHDLRVLMGMDWTRSVDVICVETLDMVHPERKIGGVWHPAPQMNAYLDLVGFKLRLLTPGGNGFYLRRGFHD